MTESLYTALAATAAHNQFFSGGALLMLFGGLVASARRLPRQALNFLADRVMMTLEVTNRDGAYHWFKQWMNDHPRSHKVRDLMLTTRGTDDDERRGGRGSC